MSVPCLTHSAPMGHESMTAKRFRQATPTLGQQRLVGVSQIVAVHARERASIEARTSQLPAGYLKELL